MVRKLIEFALNNPLVVILLAVASAAIGVFSFLNVNVEAYPDPAPAIVEVYAQFPGASAEEVERQVTIPLEVTFAGMPELKFIHSKSLFGLSDLKMNWEYGPWTYEMARQEVINRISTIAQPLPANVTPTISPESPTGEIYRYMLTAPKDGAGHDIYTLNDIKAMQDWVMEREFRTVQRIVDLTSYGGTVRRYEVQPDPDRLKRYGITLTQLQTALANSNATVGGDYVNQGQLALTVRSVGLFGGGKDPMNMVLGYANQDAVAYLAAHNFTAEQRHRILAGLSLHKVEPPLSKEELGHVEAINRAAAIRAAGVLRAQEYRRIGDIRSLVVASINNQPVRVEDLVEGGRVSPGQLGDKGVVVSNQTRLGCVGHYKADREREPGSAETLADVGHDDADRVQCIVLMRKNEDTLPALKGVKSKVEQVNDIGSGRQLPGVKIEPYYDRTDLINVTTETVTENLMMGVLLVVTVLFMFVNNIRTAIIVAINIPLALLFAFSMLYLRGKSANLLSIGAVDFGIIVDSSVIMVENIYRNLASGHHRDLPIKERILRFVKEIDNALLFSVLIMVCAFVPLFTMSGAEGELFRPMAQTYAFSLAAALVLAITLTPVMCMLMFKNFAPVRENLLVRALKFRYFWKLKLCLKYRWTLLTIMSILFLGTFSLIPHIGREFMPELEEGNLWIRGTAPLNQSLDRNIEIAKQSRAIIASYPEVEAIVSQSGRPDDGTDIEGYENTESFVPMRPRQDWPRLVDQTGWRSWLGWSKRQRTKEEVVSAMDAELRRKIPGVNWNFSQNIRDNVMEALSGFKGDNSLKIIGPEVEHLELLANKVASVMKDVPGMEDVGVIHEMGQSHLEFRVDPAKCERWGVMTADVNNVVQSALGARAMSSMVEGEKLFDISIRWPKRLRNNETSILDIPVDVINNQVVLNQYPGTGSGAVSIPIAKGFAHPDPAPAGTLANTANPMSQQAPRLRLRDLVSPVAEDGSPDPGGQFERAAQPPSSASRASA